MTDRPIIFSAPMVRALIEGRKTQTRRILKAPRDVDPEHWMPNTPGRLGAGISGDRFAVLHWPNDGAAHAWGKLPCAVGDQLWVREAHALLPRTAYRGSIGTGTIEQREHPTDGYSAAVFREGFDRSGRPLWRPSIHMPRWASRLTLVVTAVRVERLQDISEADAIAEGIERSSEFSDRFLTPAGDYAVPVIAYRRLWESIHGADTWDANPWVAAISFTVHRANIDALPIYGPTPASSTPSFSEVG